MVHVHIPPLMPAAALTALIGASVASPPTGLLPYLIVGLLPGLLGAMVGVYGLAQNARRNKETAYHDQTDDNAKLAANAIAFITGLQAEITRLQAVIQQQEKVIMEQRDMNEQMQAQVERLQEVNTVLEQQVERMREAGEATKQRADELERQVQALEERVPAVVPTPAPTATTPTDTAISGPVPVRRQPPLRATMPTKKAAAKKRRPNRGRR